MTTRTSSGAASSSARSRRLAPSRSPARFGADGREERDRGGLRPGLERAERVERRALVPRAAGEEGLERGSKPRAARSLGERLEAHLGDGVCAADEARAERLEPEIGLFARLGARREELPRRLLTEQGIPTHRGDQAPDTRSDPGRGRDAGVRRERCCFLEELPRPRDVGRLRSGQQRRDEQRPRASLGGLEDPCVGFELAREGVSVRGRRGEVELESARRDAGWVARDRLRQRPPGSLRVARGERLLGDAEREGGCEPGVGLLAEARLRQGRCERDVVEPVGRVHARVAEGALHEACVVVGGGVGPERGQRGVEHPGGLAGFARRRERLGRAEPGVDHVRAVAGPPRDAEPVALGRVADGVPNQVALPLEDRGVGLRPLLRAVHAAPRVAAHEPGSRRGGAVRRPAAQPRCVTEERERGVDLATVRGDLREVPQQEAAPGRVVRVRDPLRERFPPELWLTQLSGEDLEREPRERGLGARGRGARREQRDVAGRRQIVQSRRRHTPPSSAARARPPRASSTT